MPCWIILYIIILCFVKVFSNKTIFHVMLHRIQHTNITRSSLLIHPTVPFATTLESTGSARASTSTASFVGSLRLARSTAAFAVKATFITRLGHLVGQPGRETRPCLFADIDKLRCSADLFWNLIHFELHKIGHLFVKLVRSCLLMLKLHYSSIYLSLQYISFVSSRLLELQSALVYLILYIDVLFEIVQFYIFEKYFL